MKQRSRLKEKLTHKKRLRVLFLNDLGFQYGAGTAQFRQIQSLLLMGCEVAALCWEGGIESDFIPTPLNADGIWLGIHKLNGNPIAPTEDAKKLSAAIISQIKHLNPDVVIVGNMHYITLPLDILLTLRKEGIAVIAFMHDCYFVTGRCVYPGRCEKYISGCDDKCPTANEYPVQKKSNIEPSWELRKKLFCGPEAIPIAVNSKWTLDFARKALHGEVRYADVVYYGLDEKLFYPIDRSLARRLLGIPQDDFVVLFGAVNISDKRKGWPIFKKIISKLKQEVNFIVFGEHSMRLQNVNPVGLLRDYRKMPLLYSAANLFVATSLEEAFGQTVIEAAACQIPVVAFNSGGIPEIARHEVNGLLLDRRSPSAVLDAIQFFLKNPNACETFGKAGRQMIEKEFSLKKQGERWMVYLHKVADQV